MKYLLITIFSISLLGCKEDAQTITQNGNFKVEFLFEHDGCRMYRFKDVRTVYWSDCRGKIQSDYTTSNGKTSQTHYEETITTR